MAWQHSHIFVVVTLFSLVSSATFGRQEFGPYLPPRMEMGDIVTAEEIANEVQQKYMDQDVNFLAKWPWLRDLLPPPEIESNTDKIPYPPQERIFIEIPEPLPTPLPQRRISPIRGNSLKDQGQKKNSYKNEYMSPCHFKICNMGRKRNVRFLPL